MDKKIEENGMTGSEMTTPEQFPIYSCMQQASGSAGSTSKNRGTRSKDHSIGAVLFPGRRCRRSRIGSSGLRPDKK